MILQKTRHFFHHNVASFIETIFTSGKTTTWNLLCLICEKDRIKNLTGTDKIEAQAFWNGAIQFTKEGKI